MVPGRQAQFSPGENESSRWIGDCRDAEGGINLGSFLREPGGEAATPTLDGRPVVEGGRREATAPLPLDSPASAT